MTTRTQLAVGKKRKAKRLAKTACDLVEEKAGEISEALMDRKKRGKVMRTKLLVELAEGDVDGEEAPAKKPHRSLALRLENEPEVAADEQKQAENT